MLGVKRWTLYRPVPSGSPVTGLTIKAALVIGFGVTLGVWLWSGYQLTTRMTELENRTSEINTRYMRAQELLAGVRAQVLQASVSVRDALLDPDSTTAMARLERFEDILRAADDAVRQYVPVMNSADEQPRIDALRREIEDFHRAMLAVLTIDGPEWRRDARALLQQAVSPRREVVMRVSNQVQALNRSAFIEQRTQTAALYREAQRRAWLRLGGALAAGLAIGLAAILYAGRLEGSLKRQRRRDLQLTDDLHRLSVRMTTLQEDERRAIARELHDEVGQALTAMRVGLALAQDAVDDPKAIERIADARGVAENTLQRIRSLSHLLHPPMLDDLGLPAALKSHIEGFSKRHGIEVELVEDRMTARLMPEAETALYRIVQEALTNVAKHARAQTCRVTLRAQAGRVRVTIEDDGRGFDASSPRPLQERGLGLIGIRERVAQLGGVLQIESGPGRGASVIVDVPAPSPNLQDRDSVDESLKDEHGHKEVAHLLGDDHRLVREGFRTIIETRTDWDVVGEASDGRETVRQVEKLKPDVAIIDIGMPLLNGIEATRHITRSALPTRMMILSMHLNESYVTTALQAGAAGYMLKDSAYEDLIHGVTAVAMGKSFFSPAVAKVMLDDYVRHLTTTGAGDRYDTLSDREREIFQLIAEGHTNKEVAEMLSLSPTTVDTHRAHILQKLDVHNTAELVLYAVRRGIIS